MLSSFNELLFKQSSQVPKPVLSGSFRKNTPSASCKDTFLPDNKHDGDFKCLSQAGERKIASSSFRQKPVDEEESIILRKCPLGLYALGLWLDPLCRVFPNWGCLYNLTGKFYCCYYGRRICQLVSFSCLIIPICCPFQWINVTSWGRNISDNKWSLSRWYLLGCSFARGKCLYFQIASWA